MKTSTKLLTLLLLWGMTLPMLGQELSPKEIVRKADEKFNGEKSSISQMAMTIVRPTWERTVEFKGWSSGRDYSLTLQHTLLCYCIRQ